MAMFICLGLENRGQNLMPDEKIKNKITTLDKAVKMVFSGRIKDAKTIAAVMTLQNIYQDKRLFKKYMLK
jgi:20S proteasome alpha/beta subunit